MVSIYCGLEWFTIYAKYPARSNFLLVLRSLYSELPQFCVHYLLFDHNATCFDLQMGLFVKDNHAKSVTRDAIVLNWFKFNCIDRYVYLSTHYLDVFYSISVMLLCGFPTRQVLFFHFSYRFFDFVIPFAFWNIG